MNNISLIALFGLFSTLVLALPLDRIDDVEHPEDGLYFKIEDSVDENNLYVFAPF